jgi:hypothetical protein
VLSLDFGVSAYRPQEKIKVQEHEVHPAVPDSGVDDVPTASAVERAKQPAIRDAERTLNKEFGGAPTLTDAPPGATI